MARALRFNPNDKISVVYSDFSRNLDKNPVTSEIIRLTNNDAIENSLQNLALTSVGERFYHPEIGSRIESALFELDDTIAIDMIKITLTETITQQEPRVVLKGIECQFDPINNGVNVKIVYTLRNTPEVIETQFFVKRNR